ELTDSFGRHVSFRNVILIMTSNIGADLIKNKAGFGFAVRSEDADYDKIKVLLNTEIERYFRPEFINRLDDVIVFRPLTKDNLVGIVEFELKKVFQRLEERGMHLEVDQSAKDFLIEKGYNPDFGARPLRRAIEQYVEDPLSEAILREEFVAPCVVHVSRAEGGEEKLAFRSEPKPEPAKDEAGDSSEEVAEAEAGA
ncbi:MAG: AAA family ATPase, partial [Planctomycetota bacterium]